VQLVDHGGETAARLIEEKEAPLQRRGLGSLVSLVYRVVPDLPVVVLVSRSRALRRRWREHTIVLSSAAVVGGRHNMP
jgi:hypothetical protein